VQHVLIVDDDKVYREMIRDGLEVHGSLAVLTASNGLEAKTCLENRDVDLVVTDLHMPKMDGFALLAHLRRNASKVPVIVMSTDFSEALEAQLLAQGTLKCLKKPFAPDVLAEIITPLLADRERGHLQDISIASFLQLLGMEQKTCTLEVTRADRIGRLWLRDGRLIDAEFESFRGETAAQEIIAWDVADRIETENVCEATEPTVVTELQFLIMEALRIKDESEAEMKRSEERAAGTAAEEAEDPPDDELPIEDGTPVFDASAGSDFPPDIKAAVRRQLLSLREVPGYRASALLTEGEVLVSDSVESDLNLVRVCKALHEVFVGAREASARVGLAACDEAVFHTPASTVPMLHADLGEAADLQLLVLLSPHGEEGPMRAWMKRIMPKIRSEILLVLAPELILPD